MNTIFLHDSDLRQIVGGVAPPGIGLQGMPRIDQAVDMLGDVNGLFFINEGGHKKVLKDSHVDVALKL
jgi:hypothetical protein